MLDPAAALSLVLDQSFDWGTEAVPLSRAGGRTLRQTVHADRDQPPFDRVAMDGIALYHPTYAAGTRRFPVAHLAPAGTAPRALTDPTHCVEIMTGAPLPPGVTTVVPYELLERDGAAFVVPENVTDAQHLHRRASDAAAGSLALSDGTCIGPAALAVLATYGIAEVEVTRLPRVAIASTGDEVVAVDRTPLPHQIRSSNVHQLAGLFRDFGIEPTLGHLPDDPSGGQETLRHLLDTHDLLLLSGGVSKGKLDHVPDWLAAAGINCLFHRVAQRPGKPLWVGRNRTTMVFALPGNPVSSLVGTVAYVGPFLRRELGLKRPDTRVTLAREMTFTPDLTLFKQATLENREGHLYAHPLDAGGSGNLMGLIATEGFVVLPRGHPKYAAGDTFDYLPISLR